MKNLGFGEILTLGIFLIGGILIYKDPTILKEVVYNLIWIISISISIIISIFIGYGNEE